MNAKTKAMADMLYFLEQNGMLGDVVDIAVNGPKGPDGEVLLDRLNECFLAWYPDGDVDITNAAPDVVDRNVVAAAFHMLGNEVMENAHPLAAYPIILELIDLRNKSIQLMRDIPR